MSEQSIFEDVNLLLCYIYELEVYEKDHSLLINIKEYYLPNYNISINYDNNLNIFKSNKERYNKAILLKKTILDYKLVEKIVEIIKKQDEIEMIKTDIKKEFI
jgi:hypothetical protein